MTNPLSSLNRYPRRPFKETHFSKINDKLLNITGEFNYPQSHNSHNFDLPISDSELNDLLDDVTTNIAKTNISKYSKGMPKSTLAPATGSYTARSSYSTSCPPLTHDNDLIAKLMKRIKDLESIRAFQEKEIKDKNLRIKILEDKCQLYQKSKEIFENKADKVNGLESLCQQLQTQISEMENFLADYGLMWVGEDSYVHNNESESRGVSDQTEILPEDRKELSPEKFVVNYDKILKNIEELNLLVKSDESLITLTGPQRVELKAKPSIRLILYANGISLFNGPFRSFEDKSTRCVIQDIDDGYFPSELEERYPSGVPIQVTDRRNIFYDAKQINIFQGIGKTLGGLSTSSKLLNFTQDKEGNHYTQPFTEVMMKDPSSQMTVQQFLDKLPTSTISNDGRIMSIRNSIRDIIENTKPLVSDFYDKPNESSPDELDHGAQIKIRSLNGDNVYHIGLRPNELVKDLYQKLGDIIGAAIDSFVLVSAFPPNRKLIDMDATIEDCGLTPNASLCMRLVN